jgi:hypothetical protein
MPKSQGFILVPLLESRIEPEYADASELDNLIYSPDLCLKTGVARLNNVMSQEMAQSLRKLVLAELEKARSVAPTGDPEPCSSDQFSTVLSAQNRWDFRLHMFPEVILALQTLLAPGSAVGDLLAEVVLNDGKLFELGAFVTINGATRQDVHSDTKWSEDPAIYTSLFALQDISADMGPTIFFPSTQTKEPVYNAPVQHQGEGPQSGLQLDGASNPFVLATLNCGDAAVYDSRTLHCGGGNSSDKIRVIFYFSFINAAGPQATQKDFWNVTSILPEYVDKFCLDDFRAPK